MNENPRYLYGDKGIIGLIHWIKEMESIYKPTNVLKDYWVKFTTYIYMKETLNWWNTKAKTLGVNTTYVIS